jgi:hypothetical protein
LIALSTRLEITWRIRSLSARATSAGGTEFSSVTSRAMGAALEVVDRVLDGGA